MKPSYLGIFKYGSLIMSCMAMAGMLAGMVGNKWIIVVLFLSLGFASFFGAAIVFYLDAIYEKLNSHKP